MIDIAHVINSKTSYKCSHCGYYFGQIEEIPKEWNYCPVCVIELEYSRKGECYE